MIMNQRMIAYSDDLRPQLLTVWEQSVLATHDFLKPADFTAIRDLVRTIDFSQFQIFCTMDECTLTGFVGVQGRKVEMLFIDPNYFRRGLGRKLMNHVMTELDADQVDVNEQNTMAVLFYQSLGFAVYERADRDDQGHEYPLLRMKRK